MWENFIFTYFPRKLFWRVPCRKKRTSGLSILRQSWLCFWPLISNSNCLQAELQSKICEESMVDFFYEIRLGHQHNSASAFWSRSPSRISGHTIKSLTTVICWADWDRNFFFFFQLLFPSWKCFRCWQGRARSCCVGRMLLPPSAKPKLTLGVLDTVRGESLSWNFSFPKLTAD